MAQTAAELLDYYRNALSPIATHAALQSQLAERDAAIRQQQAQRAQALQDQLTYAAQIDQYQRQAAAKHAIDTRNTELMRTGLQTQGEIARTVIANKAETERARALAGIAQQSQIAGEKRKTEQLGGEAANLQRFQDLSRDRLNQLRDSLEKMLTPPDAVLSKAAVEAARAEGETDNAMLASIAANPHNLDSIKDRGKRDRAKEAYTTAVEKYQLLASKTDEARALARQVQHEDTNYQALSQQFAQVAGFLTPERQAQIAMTSFEPANAFSPTAATAPTSAPPSFDSILGAIRTAAQQRQPADAATAPTGPSPLMQRIATTPFLAPSAQATPFDVPVVGGVENAIGQGLAGLASDTANGTRRPLITADVNPGLIGQIGSRMAGAGLTIAGLPSFAGLQSMHDARNALTSMLPSWLYQPSPVTSPQGIVPTNALQQSALAQAANTVDANNAAAALAGVIPALGYSTPDKKRVGVGKTGR